MDWCVARHPRDVLQKLTGQMPSPTHHPRPPAATAFLRGLALFILLQQEAVVTESTAGGRDRSRYFVDRPKPNEPARDHRAFQGKFGLAQTDQNIAGDSDEVRPGFAGSLIGRDVVGAARQNSEVQFRSTSRISEHRAMGRRHAVISSANAVAMCPFQFGLETRSLGTKSASQEADLFRSAHLPNLRAARGTREADLRGGDSETQRSAFVVTTIRLSPVRRLVLLNGVIALRHVSRSQPMT
jgi:hypothetical protein